MKHINSENITPAEESLKRYLALESENFNRTLNILIPGEDEKPERLHRAMRHSLFAGGKRLRPILLKAVAEGFNFNPELVYPAGSAVEMIHTYSLIHDDLPSLDNDDLRRGKPTCHKAFDEATAILAGDALNTAAFGVLASLDYPDDLKSAGLQVIAELSDYAGLGGMVAGQMADIDAEEKEIFGEELEFIHRNKTGGLIIWSARAGALLSGADETSLTKLTKLAELIGISFQIKDDILDITSTPQELGKTTGKDAEQSKATYPAVHGMEKAENDLEKFSAEAMEIGREFAQNCPWLYYIIDYLLKRRN